LREGFWAHVPGANDGLANWHALSSANMFKHAALGSCGCGV